VIVGFSASLNFVPFPKYQSQLFGVLVLLLVSNTASGAMPEVTFAVKFATTGEPAGLTLIYAVLIVLLTNPLESVVVRLIS
jgi:hypothetical protein